MSDQSIILIGNAQIPAAESFEVLVDLVTQASAGNGFVMITDAVSALPMAINTKDIALFRPASGPEREQIQQVRLQNSGITIPNMKMPTT